MAQHPLNLGVALDGYGWHPQAWRRTLVADPIAAPATSGRHWAQLAATAERGLLDFLTIDDSLAAQPGRREEIDPRRLAGRADAVLVASRIAPVTRNIGLIPVATVTHTEPFHVSKAIATLDFVSHGRAGWQARVSPTAHEAAAFGRRTVLDGTELFDEAADFVDVVRRLWDSWEDDAVIRDVATGRYVDRGKLHYIDFRGSYFSVKGPSITPRPPQGQPVVAALAHAQPVYEFANAAADLVFVTPSDEASVRALLGRVDGKVIADLVVSFAGDSDFRSDAQIFAGAPADLVELLLGWHDLGVAGFRLRPAVNATDLPVIVDEVVPYLQRAGRFRTRYRDGETLRERFGLPASVNRYAEVGSS
ncbi:alkanesulfonate monooxygenase SsuD/methylene tetrahydromethanopterin reductase-like flavin-dependent oxidoreductase (luciferase family) [Mycolicibacterium sp. BK556]|uniref:LLM class flavin-dependent oxidoreductase n=1 Tax=unclassified Mycolicibacterium TaxID=2636767 RepID=UPI00160FF0BA|nr:MULTISPECIES: LLM class flavin-dependent oxidoreductase [unclassified Mycolicibacterium]MBB3605021.1 alkanesulfonate monooxygenase SsuD/methylene tetrahydromethanopterin reductase-like flavin-dependent oxidoreductase (luciferase family) [Mycolicibacterium sp. BK556]MBB3635217.1 alkanesulfonate monooxygenase SsuD/methylene tetrahydromethanopterin reductase-like flavin-dependent oxidoreductase (luciferase family) [Mycolicibacterium sp. BK607]